MAWYSSCRWILYPLRSPTLSGKLSGSYSNAVIGNSEATENGTVTACVFDSKSASAGETLIAIKIYELIKAGTPKELINKTIDHFMDRMKTYFVLESNENLRKNGRLNKITGTLVQMLNIKLIMDADGNGEIALFEKARGIKEWLGHSDFAITANTYAHLEYQSKQNSADSMKWIHKTSLGKLAAETANPV